MMQLLSKICPAGSPVSDHFHPAQTLKQNPTRKSPFGSTPAREKGRGFRIPQVFFRKSFTCHAKASRFLSRPIPLFMNILRRDGLVGKGQLIAWQVSSSFVAGRIRL